jgi:hypothetical protein
MMGLGDGNFFTDLVDNLSGGEYGKTKGQLERLETLLKWSIAASLIAGLLTAADFFWRRTR